MNEKKIIEQYFNNYFSRKNKKVYNEDIITIFAVGSFLYFLMYVLLRVFTVNKFEKENIAYRLEKNPQQVEQIIRFLDEIKRTIKNDISDKKLDKAFSIIDLLDKYLLSFKRSGSHEESKLILDKITSNIKSLLEEILILYLNKDQIKKQNIFNKLRIILNQFGLMDKFELILKQVLEKSNNVITSDAKEEVTVKPEVVIDTVVTSPGISDRFDNNELTSLETTPYEITEPGTSETEDLSKKRNPSVPQIITITDEEPIDSNTLRQYDDEDSDYLLTTNPEEDDEDDEERKKRIKEQEREEEIKKISSVKRNKDKYMSMLPDDLVIAVILRSDKFFEEDDLMLELYNILNSGKSLPDIRNDLQQSSVYRFGLQLIEQYTIINDYNLLNNFLKTKKIRNNGLIITPGIEIDNDKYYLEIKIYKDQYEQGVIKPLKSSDFDNNNFKDFYILRFIRKSGIKDRIFSIFMLPSQEEDYNLFKINPNLSFRFIYGESSNKTFEQFNVEICTGTWALKKDGPKETLSFTGTEFKEDKYRVKDIDVDDNNRVFILHSTANLLTERKQRVSPTPIELISKIPFYYYCISVEINKEKIFLIKPITTNFINVVKHIHSTKKIIYISKNKTQQFLVLDPINNKSVLESINRTKSSGDIYHTLSYFTDTDKRNETADMVFNQVNDAAISFSGPNNLVKINMNVAEWMYTREH